MGVDKGGVMRFPKSGAKVLYLDRAGVLHSRSWCGTVPSEGLTPRIDPGDDEPRCHACCDDLIES